MKKQEINEIFCLKTRRKLHGRHRCNRQHNIKVCLRKMDCDIRNWFELAHDGDPLVNFFEYRVPQRETSWPVLY
jgi:hypothetical protein